MAFYFVSTFAIAQTPTKQPALRLSRTKNLHFAKAPFPGFSAIGIDEAELMQRLNAMQEQNIIRRIGAVPNHYKLGYRHNGMTVWDIDDNYIDELGNQVGALDFVSHCYHRPRHLPGWQYNLFAMVHSKTAADAALQINQIAALLGTHSRAHEVLYSTRILKKNGLRIKENNVST